MATVLQCYGMLWHAMTCYGMLWHATTLQDATGPNQDLLMCSIRGYVERKGRAECLWHEGCVVLCVYAAHVRGLPRVRRHGDLGRKGFMRFEHGRELYEINRVMV